MTRLVTLSHEFVDYLPDTLSEGVLYVSIPFATSAHLCCCGCGSEVVNPLSPTDWKLVFDGESVSLSPSIGNWSFDCQSHYVIDRNRVRWAGHWSRSKIEDGRERDRQAKILYYGEGADRPDNQAPAQDRSDFRRWVRRLWRRTRRFGMDESQDD